MLKYVGYSIIFDTNNYCVLDNRKGGVHDGTSKSNIDCTRRGWL